MKHQTHQYRAERKMGLHKAPQKPETLFASEIVLADAPLAVQELLHSAMVHKSRERFHGVVKPSGHVVSTYNKRTRKHVKTRVPFPTVWNSTMNGTYRRPEAV